MLPTSHFLAGFGIAAALELSGTLDMTGPLIALAVIASIIPDTDGLFVKDMSNHHDGPLHAPDFWIVICGLIYLLVSPIYAILVGTGVLFHLLCDFIVARTYGLEIFYPFSRRDFSLFELDKSRGHFNPSRPSKEQLSSYLSFYIQNKPALFYEISINFLGVASLVYLLFI